jgi:hypothetical protein
MASIADAYDYRDDYRRLVDRVNRTTDRELLGFPVRINETLPPDVVVVETRCPTPGCRLPRGMWCSRFGCGLFTAASPNAAIAANAAHPVEDAFELPPEVRSVDPGCATSPPPVPRAPRA